MLELINGMSLHSDFVAVPQVEAEHYRFQKYVGRDRWMNYWYQIKYVLASSPRKVLEIGPGDKTVSQTLKKCGIEVVTADIDPALGPDVVAPVTALPFADREFDAVLCSEVLEHLPFTEFVRALQELKRVTRGRIVLGLPHPGIVFLLLAKLPLLRYSKIFFKIPFFYKRHVFNGEHYWEIGKKEYGLGLIKGVFDSVGLDLIESRVWYDDPGHRFFILEARKHESTRS